MSFFSKFFGWIKGLITKVTPEVKTIVEIGIKLVENIKTYVNDPAVDVLTAIIPGEADDMIKNAIRAFLPKLLAELQFLKVELDNDEIIAFIYKIQTAEEAALAILTHGIASSVNNVIADEIGSISQAFITTQVVYESESEGVKNA